MRLSKKQKVKLLSIIVIILLLLVSCDENGGLIQDPNKLVSEMEKGELLWSIFFITLITGLLTN